MKSFIVASASPRRKEILEAGGYSFEVIPSDCDESIGEITPEEAVQVLSERKALSVLENNRESVVLASDTVVAIENEILGKPENEADAFNMLRKLSGKTHKVCTGVTVADGERTETFLSVTEVQFYSLSDETIKSYISSGEPMDKAGGYGIQGLGAALVKAINGDYYTVVGLPFGECMRVLRDFGITGTVEV